MKMKNVLFSLLFLLVSVRCMDGQTPPAVTSAVPFPPSFIVSNNLVHIIDPVSGIPGQQRLEPVFLPTGWTLLQVGGAWVLMNNNPPAGPTLQGLTTWVTMAQSALDPLTWCLGVAGIGPTAAKDVQPTLLDIWSRLTVPTGQMGAGTVNDAESFMRVQHNPDPSQVNAGFTSSVPPLWNLNACGAGLPGVQFPPTWLQAGEVRTNVQVLVAY